METEDTPNLVIWIITEKLSDGSEGFNVEINGESYPAITERDAEALAYGLADLIEKHTNATAAVIHD